MFSENPTNKGTYQNKKSKGGGGYVSVSLNYAAFFEGRILRPRDQHAASLVLSCGWVLGFGWF